MSWSGGLCAFVACLLTSGCGAPRQLGEPDGIPVAFSVELRPGYIDGMSMFAPRSPPMFIDPGPCRGPSPRYRYYGRGPYERSPFGYDPFWADPGFTSVVLAGGDGPAAAGLFRTTVSGGDNHFEVSIKPGRVVTLTVQVRGDRDGWETVGHFTAADRPGQRVDLTLTADGPKMTVTAPDQPAMVPPAADEPVKSR